MHNECCVQEGHSFQNLPGVFSRQTLIQSSMLLDMIMNWCLQKAWVSLYQSSEEHSAQWINTVKQNAPWSIQKDWRPPQSLSPQRPSQKKQPITDAKRISVGLGTGHYLCGGWGRNHGGGGGQGPIFSKTRGGPKENFTMIGGGSLCDCEEWVYNVEDLIPTQCNVTNDKPIYIENQSCVL